jgi:hypothetical protein
MSLLLHLVGLLVEARVVIRCQSHVYAVSTLVSH